MEGSELNKLSWHSYRSGSLLCFIKNGRREFRDWLFLDYSAGAKAAALLVCEGAAEPDYLPDATIPSKTTWDGLGINGPWQ